ncbi:4-hydroxy-tetrahydrodipicolinate reductase [Macrococcus hajekii]|uniref:4-hydroxy-tetrahydrodipicolinate reductase n=1 Tax=Macrococcus hajekii TaxID=198482 RepID=A0A4R6BJ76_9STAP|nr:4-hydroxy-tetrahydrodipicolinate reductase [Macrococcus hajekii]TDM01749.1 4-hydroxy-tetrahydrodipicolinate reductase [Macrococcus hajekii]GGB07117.1 4-hydroxy-tetrahydrodipicolinate reductase [Macrococcus hajekii]
MKILLVGYGAMNERVARLAEERGDHIAGIITKSDKIYPYPSFKIEEQWPEADVIIDFSHPELSLPVIRKQHDIPLVMATTGRKEEIIEALEGAAETKPVFFSANMSYGVHILTEIIKYSVPLLQNFDIELTEKHHRKKVDAPSGTLVKLYDAIKEKREAAYPVYDRTQTEQARSDEEIGINVVRGGTIVGEHEVLFAGHDETIQIIHRAQSKDIFASGSLDVAEQLVSKKQGYYTFDNL